MVLGLRVQASGVLNSWFVAIDCSTTAAFLPRKLNGVYRLSRLWETGQVLAA